MNRFVDKDHDVDQHHPGRYCDPNTPMSSRLLRHALMWMEGMPEYEEECQAIHDALAQMLGSTTPKSKGGAHDDEARGS